MKNLLLYFIVFIIISTAAFASNEFSTCFAYEGDQSYFLLSSDDEYSGDVNVYDLGSTVRIVTVLDSLTKPFLAYGEKDRDGDGTVEPDELRSDGIDIGYGAYDFEWIVYGGSMDSEITVEGYPDVTYMPITYSFVGPEPADGEEVCLDVHASPNGKCLLNVKCKGIKAMSLSFDYDFDVGDEVKVEVYSKKNKLKDVETGTVASSNVNNSHIAFDLVLDDISTSGVEMTLYASTASDGKGKKKDKLDSETRFKVYQNGVLIADAKIHTSCSQPIDVGDTFDGFTLTALTKKFKTGTQVDENNNGIDDLCEPPVPIPEFTAIGAILALIGAGAIAWKRRKK